MERYYSYSRFIKEYFGEKLYKICIDGGFTCPNRDGTLATGGCIFCSEGGSGEFTENASLSVSEQIHLGKSQTSRKYQGEHYIAYFQAFTNTYAPVSHLRSMFSEAISDPEVKTLSIATRPDCLGPEVLDLLDELNHQKPVWVELGLQTIHENTADFIRRGYKLSVFEEAVRKLQKIHISIIVHVILFLPGESEADMLETISYLNALPIQGIKLQLLHILENTDLADIYRETPFPVPDMNILHPSDHRKHPAHPRNHHSRQKAQLLPVVFPVHHSLFSAVYPKVAAFHPPEFPFSRKP